MKRVLFLLLLLAAALAVMTSCGGGHEHLPADAVKENEVAATCTDEGSYDEVVYCSDCGEELSRNGVTTPSEGHSYDKGECVKCFADEIVESTAGLNFRKNEDGAGYTLIGIGDCAEAVISVGVYDSLPVTAIAPYAFLECEGIEQVRLGRTVKVIGEHAFHGCRGLKRITMSDRVSRVEEGAFAYCTSLEYMSVDKYGEIDLSLLESSVNAEKGSLPDIGQYDRIISNGSFFGCLKLRGIVLPYGVQAIADKAFVDMSMLQYVVFPKTLRYIGESAFEGCSGIKYLVFEDGVEYIADKAFASVGVRSLKLPEGLRYIGDEVFYNAWSMSEIVIPSTVEYIGEWVFYQNQLPEFKVAQDCPYYRAVDGVLYSKDGKVLVCYPRAKVHENSEYTILEGTEELVQGAFYGCDLQIVNVPKTLKSLDCGPNAFQPYTDIRIDPDNPYLLNVERFSLTDDGKRLVAIDLFNMPEELVIPDGVEVIGSYAIKKGYSSQVKRLVIPDSVRIIEDHALQGLRVEEELDIGDGVEYIGSYSLTVAAIRVELGTGVRTLGDHAFGDESYLDELVLNDGLITVGDYVFTWVEKELRIPDSVEYMGKLAPALYDIIQFGEDSASLKKIGDFICSADGKTLLYYDFDYDAFYSEDDPQIVEVVVPECVEEIAEGSIVLREEVPHTVVLHGGIKRIGSISLGNVSAGDGPNSFTITKEMTYVDPVILANRIVTVEDGNEYYSVVDNNLYSKDGKSLYKYSYLNTSKSFTIPEGVEVIAPDAFRGHHHLEELILPSTMRVLMKHSLAFCRLKRVVMNEGLERIEENAFELSIYLESLVVPKSLCYIGEYAFALTSIKRVEYNGSALQWSEIEVGHGNSSVARGEFIYKEGLFGDNDEPWW